MNQPNRLLYPRTIDRHVQWENLKDYYFVHPLLNLFQPFVAWADKKSFVSSRAMLFNGRHIGKIIEGIYKKRGVVASAGTKIIPKEKLASTKEVFHGVLSITNSGKKQFSIPKPYILLTNRHVPQKKFEYALEAMKTINKNSPATQLVIPGQFTSYTKNLFRLTNKLKLHQNIIFLDQIPEKELQKLYRDALLYVYTSPDEDFGMGIIEAMGSGVPVVAWNHAGPTVTILNSKTGFLAKPYDVKDFAKNMQRIVQDKKLWQTMRKQAWIHANRNFSWQHHADILEKELQEALIPESLQ